MPMKHTLLFQTDAGGSGGGDGGGTGDSGAGTGDGVSQGDDGSGSGSGSGEDATKELEAARREAARYRTERNALKEKVEKLEGAGKTEVEKLTTSVTTLTESNITKDEQIRRLTVQVVAGRVGIAQEARADAAALLPANAVDDWDNQKSVEKALRDLVKEKPYLLGKTAGGSDGGEGGTRDEPADMNAAIRAAAGRG